MSRQGATKRSASKGEREGNLASCIYILKSFLASFASSRFN